MTTSLNPLLSRTKLPGRVFQLPSLGLFYEPGVLAPHVRNAEIEVKPMSALTELKIKSTDLLISAKIIREVCLECAPEILKPEDLTSRDVDALFTFLVSATYGNEKVVRAIHTCETAKWNDYMINLETIISNPRNACLSNKELLYQTVLPNEQKVNLRPVTFNDSIDLLFTRQQLEKREQSGDIPRHEEVEKMVIGDLMAVIKSVEAGEGDDKIAVVNRGYILEWLRTLPKKYVEQIITASQAAADWGFDFQVGLTCKDCGKPFKFDLELNPVNFFSG